MNKKISLKVFNFSILTALFFLLFVGFGFHFAKANNGNPGPGSGNVFGWAWGGTNEGGVPPAPNAGTFGIGWIRFSNCLDDDHNGVADPLSCDTTEYGVNIDDAGNLSGHAWGGTNDPRDPTHNHGIGWISFNRSETGNPPSDDPGNGVAGSPIAKVVISGSKIGTFQGWARAIVGDDTNGWDGWIHLADNSSRPALHPSGPACLPTCLDGTRGVTYNPATSYIVGNAWGSNVAGWIKFVNVTFGAQVNSVFSYNLRNSGPLNITAGGSGIETITKNLLTLPTQPVILRITNVVPAFPREVKAVIQGSNNCAPTCSSDIKVTAEAGAAAQTYNVTVSGSVGLPAPTTSFLVTVAAQQPPNDLRVICTVGGTSPYYVNRPVEWISNITGGLGQYTVDWVLSNAPSNNILVNQSGSGPEFRTTQSYSKIGRKTATLTVVDQTPPPEGPLHGSCASPISIDVILDPKIKEK